MKQIRLNYFDLEKKCAVLSPEETDKILKTPQFRQSYGGYRITYSSTSLIEVIIKADEIIEGTIDTQNPRFKGVLGELLPKKRENKDNIIGYKLNAYLPNTGKKFTDFDLSNFANIEALIEDGNLYIPFTSKKELEEISKQIVNVNKWVYKHREITKQNNLILKYFSDANYDDKNTIKKIQQVAEFQKMRKNDKLFNKRIKKIWPIKTLLNQLHKNNPEILPLEIKKQKKELIRNLEQEINTMKENTQRRLEVTQRRLEPIAQRNLEKLDTLLGTYISQMQ